MTRSHVLIVVLTLVVWVGAQALLRKMRKRAAQRKIQRAKLQAQINEGRKS